MLVDRVPVCWMRRRTAAQVPFSSGCDWLDAVWLRGGYLPRRLRHRSVSQYSCSVLNCSSVLESGVCEEQIAEQGTPPDMIRGGMRCFLNGTGVDPEEASGYSA